MASVARASASTSSTSTGADLRAGAMPGDMSGDLIAVGRIRHVYSAVIYRWNARRWAVSGTVSHARALAHLWGAWFVSVPARHGVAFARAGSGDLMSGPRPSNVVLTNAGGRWHVALR